MSQITTTTPISEIVDGYFAMWNETDPERRRAVIAGTWAEDASYLDPRFAADGHDVLNALVAAVHEQYPGYRFRLTDPIDSHNDRARWGWEFGSADGSPPVASGVDFAILASDGRLHSVTGFFAPPAHAA